jgi:hypothetical protein
VVVVLRVWVILIGGLDDSGLSVFACDVSDKEYNANRLERILTMLYA